MQVKNKKTEKETSEKEKRKVIAKHKRHLCEEVNHTKAFIVVLPIKSRKISFYTPAIS